MVRKIRLACSSIWHAVLILLPDEFSKFRVRYYNKRGCQIDALSTISPNVRIRGFLRMGSGSSIAQNCTVSGGSAGVHIGKNVMIAPGVCIIAFSHGYSSVGVAMVEQSLVEAPVVIEDDVWIASNCTIGKGVRIGTGAIVGANSFVNRDVPAYSVSGGVPARVITTRASSTPN